MSVKTPIQASYEKKVHTPPSIERHDSARPKLVKSFSGKLFRRQLELDQIRATRLIQLGYLCQHTAYHQEKNVLPNH